MPLSFKHYRARTVVGRLAPRDGIAGLSAIDWNPSEKKSSGGLWKLTQCPTCNGRKVQRCLNCLGQGST